MLFESIQAMTGKMQTIEKVLMTLTEEHSSESVHLPEDTVIERAENDAGEALEHDLALVDEDAGSKENFKCAKNSSGSFCMG